METIITMVLNPAIDKSSRVAHVLAERKLYCKPPRFEPGGGGVNVSRAIKKLGGESLLLYPLGGLTGKMLQKLLDQEGLNHRPFPIEGLIRESLVISEEVTERILPPTVPIVSKVGAGDSMVAGIVLSLARGKPLRESVLFGVAAGTAAVMTPGTKLCRLEDAERLLESMVAGSQ